MALERNPKGFAWNFSWTKVSNIAGRSAKTTCLATVCFLVGNGGMDYGDYLKGP